MPISTPAAIVQAVPPLDPRSPSAEWPQLPSIALRWDVAHAQQAADGTRVYVATDGKALYVRFDARQRMPVVATQHSNDVVTGGSNINGGIAWPDDAVWVDLWPTGPAGFQYQFESNPIGAHNESSTENVAYAPHWTSEGRVINGGYVVTMAIPFSAIHGAHDGAWRIQFVRYVRSTGALDVWSYSQSQTNPDDAQFAGSLAFTHVQRAGLPKPRIAPYVLGIAAPPSAGSDRSRAGLDYSIPVTQTASFFGTLYPDYSNVELDQQSISPSVFQRTYSEVRPFFTQAAQYYDRVGCNVCSGFMTTLYTPGIPTPREGYAFEGRNGNFGLAAFDAVGTGRDDNAGVLDYVSPDNHWSATYQHVAANIPSLVDDSDQLGFNWSNGRGAFLYGTAAGEHGTQLPLGPTGEWLDAGGGWIDQHFGFAAAIRKVGANFNPVDGFAAHPGIAGYGVYSARVWTFAPNDVLSSIGVAGILDRYQGPAGGIAQSDNTAILDILAKDSIDLQLTSGSDYWRFGNTLTPISQNGGFQVTYHSGMQNNVNNFPSHGSSSTPTMIGYNTGRYGLGRLDTWYRSSTVRVGERGFLTLTVDDTAQRFGGTAPDNVQWFDSLAYSFQIDPQSSVALGLRRVIGYAPQPNGGGNCAGSCSNISFAYHLRFADKEIYLAYGDPNTLVTIPQVIFKLIFYAGAPKGT